MILSQQCGRLKSCAECSQHGFVGIVGFSPLFDDQIRTHLESNLLTDAQSVEYLPKFVTGEALEVVKRNRG